MNKKKDLKNLASPFLHKDVGPFGLITLINLYSSLTLFPSRPYSVMAKSGNRTALAHTHLHTRKHTPLKIMRDSSM